MMMTKLERMIAGHEGFRSKPYKCPAGFWTIGYGRNIESNPLNVDETLYFARHGFNIDSYRWLLRGDVDRVVAGLKMRFPVSGVFGARFDALVDMAYNLGPARLAGFKRMWAAIERQDFDAAADEMLDSLWAKQVGRRAQTLARIMRTRKYPND